MYKIVTLLFIFSGLFSLQGFSQSTEKSQHPLLDKYYPQLQRPQIDTNKAITNQIKQEAQIKSVPSATHLSTTATKPLVTTTIIPADKTSGIPTSKTTTVPSVITTSAINNPNADVTTVAALPGKLVINTTDTVAAKMPVQQKVQLQQPPAERYMDTRLGSSTPQYDTWQKNNNGAGAVTTSPK